MAMALSNDDTASSEADDLQQEEDTECVRYVVMRCHLHSAPGMWTTYDGYVDVSVPENSSDYDIFAAAVQRLGETSFRDRRSIANAWRLDSIERRPG